jgi:hypothetical protein
MFFGLAKESKGQGLEAIKYINHGFMDDCKQYIPGRGLG